MKKLFFKIFPSDKFDSQSYLTMICGLVVVLYSLISSCGPSKAELDEAVNKAIANQIIDSTNAIVGVGDRSQINITKVIQVMKPDGVGGGTLRFLTIDGHEYIQWYSDNGASMCHSEGCTNEIHKNQ